MRFVKELREEPEALVAVSICCVQAEPKGPFFTVCAGGPDFSANQSNAVLQLTDYAGHNRLPDRSKSAQNTANYSKNLW
jgi:hypothetical protein